MGSYLPVTPRGLDRLLELQEVDLAIDRLLARRQVLESGEEVGRARQHLATTEAALAEQGLALDDVGRDQRRLEGDVDAFGQRISAEERRLFDGSVANPKELESIQAEVAGMRGRLARIEDQLLETMERREELEGRLKAFEAEAAEAQAALERSLGDSAGELATIQAGLDARTAERDAIRPAIDEDLLELYDDLRRQKKGVGAAALVDGVCQGCHQKLSAVELDRLKRADGIRRCDYCRRILVF
jgi:hypothetical protein